MDVVEPVQTELAAPIMFAPKKDGTLQFCVNYHRMNAVTIRDFYTILGMDECTDSPGDTTIFRYCTLERLMPSESGRCRSRKTAFASHHGLFRFIRMPLGLRQALGTFQRSEDIILFFVSSSLHWYISMIWSYFQSPQTSI